MECGGKSLSMRDLWPLTLQQDATDLETGRRYTQTLSVISVSRAIATQLVTPEHFAPGIDTEELAMVIVTDSEDEDGGAFVTTKDELLAFSVSLTRALAEDMGPMRAKEVLEAEGGVVVEVSSPFVVDDDAKGKA